MTREEAEKTLQDAEKIPGMSTRYPRMVEDQRYGSYSVILKAGDDENIYFVLNRYHVNILEDLQAAWDAPEVACLEDIVDM